MEKKENNDSKKFEILKLELDEAQYKEVEQEKLLIITELEQNKRMVIEEVLSDGEALLNEIEEKEKKSIWDKIMDFIFK